MEVCTYIISNGQWVTNNNNFTDIKCNSEIILIMIAYIAFYGYATNKNKKCNKLLILYHI